MYSLLTLSIESDRRVVLNRPEKYDENGRMQSKEEAEDIDIDVKKLLDEYSGGYEIMDPIKENVKEIVQKILIHGH